MDKALLGKQNWMETAALCINYTQRFGKSSEEFRYREKGAVNGGREKDRDRFSSHQSWLCVLVLVIILMTVEHTCMYVCILFCHPYFSLQFDNCDWVW